MALLTAGFTDSPMQIVDSFRGFHRFLWRGRGHRQDNHLETDQHRTVQRHPATVPAARDVDHHLRLLAEARVHRLGQQDGPNTAAFASRRVVNPSRWGILPHHDQHIAALQADKLFGKLKPVRFITYAGRPIRLNNRAVYSARIPEAPIPKIPTWRASLSNATARATAARLSARDRTPHTR